jgi:hypothetical protein
MKRKLFIGSSTKAIEIAKDIKQKILAECSDWLECDIWDEGKIFSQNKSFLDALVQASRKYDYGVLVASSDDIRLTKYWFKIIPRDNVVFEMGLFLGSLGLTRAFLYTESYHNLPSDYNGITVASYSRKKNLILGNGADIIIKGLKQTYKTYNLKPVPSAALAMGYFSSLVQPIAKNCAEQGISFNIQVIIPKDISNLETVKKSFKAKNNSEEVCPLGNSSRPFIHEYSSTPNHYWDVPTTLATLDKLMKLINPPSEIGINQESQDWIHHELRNFQGTIEVLSEQCNACKGNVSVIYVD